MDTEDTEHDPPWVGDEGDPIISGWQGLEHVTAMDSPPPADCPWPFEETRPLDDGVYTSGFRVLQQNEGPAINPEDLRRTPEPPDSPSGPRNVLSDTRSPEALSVDNTWDFQDGVFHDRYEFLMGSSHSSPI
jgi:hypothetical protein